MRRSFQVLELGEQVVIRNYDFDRDLLVEEAVYKGKDEGFKQVYKNYFGVPEYDDSIVEEESVAAKVAT